jgi:hypothetical protein
MSSERRAFPRARGPFDGVRVAMLDMDVRIYDLSAGGCFVESMVDAKVGELVHLRIDLPGESWIEVTGMVVPSTRTLGYAVRFIRFEGNAHEQLKRTVDMIASGAKP